MTYVRATTLSIKPDKVDEATRIYRSEVLPVLKAQPGHKGVNLFIDRATGKGLSTTLWDSEAQGRAYETGGTYRQLVDKLAPTFSAPPSLATYEVAVQG